VLILSSNEILLYPTYILIDTGLGLNDYFIPPEIPDWYGAENMEPTERSGYNIPYGGWGRAQPTFGEAYGADDKLEEKTVPYGYQGRTVPVYADAYGASMSDIATMMNIRDTGSFLTGFLVGAAVLLGVGYFLKKK